MYTGPNGDRRDPVGYEELEPLGGGGSGHLIDETVDWWVKCGIDGNCDSECAKEIENGYVTVKCVAIMAVYIEYESPPFGEPCTVDPYEGC